MPQLARIGRMSWLSTAQLQRTWRLRSPSSPASLSASTNEENATRVKSGWRMKPMESRGSRKMAHAGQSMSLGDYWPHCTDG